MSGGAPRKEYLEEMKKEDIKKSIQKTLKEKKGCGERYCDHISRCHGCKVCGIGTHLCESCSPSEDLGKRSGVAKNFPAKNTPSSGDDSKLLCTCGKCHSKSEDKINVDEGDSTLSASPSDNLKVVNTQSPQSKARQVGRQNSKPSRGLVSRSPEDTQTLYSKRGFHVNDIGMKGYFYYPEEDVKN